MIKRFLPTSLLGRSLMIIVMPLILLQVIAGLIFYESHWDKVSLRLSRNVAGDIAGVINLMHMYPGDINRANIANLASVDFAMTTEFRNGEILSKTAAKPADAMQETLFKALREGVRLPFRVGMDDDGRHVVIDVQLTDGVLRVVVNRKRLFSSTTYVFVIWMVGSSLILFAVATIFMRNQVKPIRRLAEAADDFGKGRDAPNFKPEGASEVRRAAAAFIAMRERIGRQIEQRTGMLSGVSHDLRTPLTRMKLQLEMASADSGLENIKDDISEMEHMLEEYLAFARGEGGEEAVPTDLGGLLDDVVGRSRRKGGVIDLHVESDIRMPLRPNAFQRAVTNLIENATRYADHVSVRAGQRDDVIEITIDDDGPGIPEAQREDVFKPFFRIDQSRNLDTGGVGLGMSIARDVVRGHGGDIELADGPGGGLRARIRLPV
ncbi:MAG: HAMP domain-containing protein [Rhodospirillaceae bacterium]|jgi:two-component system, OmpR family, osmolarity sensor histidine kinase EnvZ|nr:HAMP domain-containing protein [Rhodospirillaceae bacterium]MBT4218577.1 HAMP domain-containing protein [Rhodospirillaceae bacterium]MBT4464392.1 HAMP domain-containing protein [Rhodospirillaceae bacterium]MBT5013173.1 HAMP domain-containing protein [Rhodospirillaceae bacterium]MBT5307944.1 HAMP domain-containing protein [Rhodospirillaceae bacterium]